MAITSQAGVFGFGPQSAKETVATTLYKHRAADIDLAIMSDDRLGPPEVGGSPVPTIPYRAGVMAAGGATISPRLANTFGWLLQGVAGDVTTTSGQDVFGVTDASMYHHTFAFDTTSESFVPWMTFYKEIPAALIADRIGETYIDCKVIGMTTTLPNDGLIQSRVDVIGRMATGTQFQLNPSVTFGNTNYEDYQSIPIGSVIGGYIKVPGFSSEDLPVAAATLSLQNAPLDIRQEKVYGSPFLEDVTIVGRSLTVDLIVKWKDPQLYRSIITGSTSGTAWTVTPFVQDLDVFAMTGLNASAISPWQLRFKAPQIMYQMVGGIRLAGNEAVMIRLQGTAIKGTQAYYEIHLGNTHPAYVWPT